MINKIYELDNIHLINLSVVVGAKALITDNLTVSYYNDHAIE